jgi:hypothetical protein
MSCPVVCFLDYKVIQSCKGSGGRQILKVWLSNGAYEESGRQRSDGGLVAGWRKMSCPVLKEYGDSTEPGSAVAAVKHPLDDCYSDGPRGLPCSRLPVKEAW